MEDPLAECFSEFPASADHDAGISVGSLLGGTSVVEVIFSYPGLGSLAVAAITSNDYNLIQGYVLWIAFIYMVINLIVDISYNFVDPRMRLGGDGYGDRKKRFFRDKPNFAYKTFTVFGILPS